MHVCLACYRGNPYCGGQGIYLLHLSRALAAEGVRVTVLTGPPYPDPMPWARVERIENGLFWGRKPREFLRETGPGRLFRPLNFLEFAATRTGYLSELLAFSYRAANRMLRLHRETPFDLIHDAETLGFGLLWARAGLGLPTVSTVHHPLRRDLEASLSRAKTLSARYFSVVFYPLIMQAMVARRIDGMITSSKVGVGELQEAFGVRPEQVHLVYTGVSTGIFSPGPWERREADRILFVGNAEDRRKGIRYLLEALAMLPSQVRLRIVDQGIPHKRFAPSQVRALGLENRVTFTGRLSEAELLEEYQRARVLILPSLFEGFGLPVAEAMACGTPVVTTRAGSLPEVVGDDEEGGLLVPPKSPRALSQAIAKLLADDDLSQDLGRRARRRAERLFSWKRTAENTILVYQKLIGRRAVKQTAAMVKGTSPCLTTKTS